MFQSMVMHDLDYNEIAACEEWYYRYHGPQLVRRYGPWMDRFESYRPVPLPKDLSEEELGYTNWLVTTGFWRGVPEEGPHGEMTLTSPKIDARNFHALLPAQWENDFKGWEISPDEKACLRLLIFWQYPDHVDKTAADAEFLDTVAADLTAVDEIYRFFGSRTLAEELHLPGTWKPELDLQRMQGKGPGKPTDHSWDRVTECWFETFDEVRAFLKKAKSFRRPSWAETDSFPYLHPYEHFISTFLLERPAYDWMQNFNVYR